MEASTKVLKVKAHQDISLVTSLEQLQNFFGNALADTLAGVAAGKVQMSPAEAELVNRYHVVAYLCTIRNAICEWVSRQGLRSNRHWNVPVPSAPLRTADGVTSLQRALEASKHVLVKQANRALRCTNCGVTRKGLSLRPWLLRPCFGGVAAEGLIPAASKDLELGIPWNLHRLRHAADGFFCLLCNKHGEAGLFGEPCSDAPEFEKAACSLEGSQALYFG